MVNFTANSEDQNAFCCSDPVHESIESFDSDSDNTQGDSITANPEEQNDFHLPDFKKVLHPISNGEYYLAKNSRKQLNVCTNK